MPSIYLVRHAKPLASWGDHRDSELDPEGQRQAEETARQLFKSLPPVQLYSSPLRRCRETARPLEILWQQSAIIMEQFSEIPAPEMDKASRQVWLKQVFAANWEDMAGISPRGAPDFMQWRQTLLGALSALPGDSLVFTHFIAINAAVAASLSSDKVLVFKPDHCSVTHLEMINGRLRLIERGREAETTVLTR